MSAKVSTSKKPSDASFHSDRPPRPVFFLDRCLGRYVVAEALRAAGEVVELHPDHFPQESPDPIWLPEVGRRGWIVLTKDRSIKSNQIEIASLMQANTFCFNLVSASLTGSEMAIAFVSALPDMKQLILRKPRPLVANISTNGRVSILLQHDDLMQRFRQ
ncbi:MAG: hypothetical protein ACREIW_05595 [Chthoniobacterales bacterium]